MSVTYSVRNDVKILIKKETLVDEVNQNLFVFNLKCIKVGLETPIC